MIKKQKTTEVKGLEGLPLSFIKWFKKRPHSIQEAIIKKRPDKLYKIKETNEQCFILSYFEPETVKNCGDEKNIEEVTVKVQKTGLKLLSDEHILDVSQFPWSCCSVFGIKLSSLEEWNIK